MEPRLLHLTIRLATNARNVSGRAGAVAQWFSCDV